MYKKKKQMWASLTIRLNEIQPLLSISQGGNKPDNKFQSDLKTPSGGGSRYKKLYLSDHQLFQKILIPSIPFQRKLDWCITTNESLFHKSVCPSMTPVVHNVAKWIVLIESNNSICHSHVIFHKIGNSAHSNYGPIWLIINSWAARGCLTDL